MSLRISCPACKIVITVGDEARGRNVRCAGCGKVLAIPAGVRAPAPTPPPETQSIKPAAGPATDFAFATPVQQPAPPTPAPPHAIAVSVAAPIPQLPPAVAGAAASAEQKAKSKKSGVPIAVLLAGGGAVVFLFVLICAGTIGAVLIFRSDKKPADVPLDRQAKKPAKAKEETKPAPEPIVDANAGKPLPAQMPEDILKRVKAATVHLRVTRQGGGVSEGSGFFAIQPGIVITNAHVLGMLHAGSRAPIDVQVTLNSGETNEVKLDGAVLGVDRQSDLAIVRIGESPFLPTPLLLEGERKPFETQEVFIFGFPYGEQLGAGITISKSGVSRLPKNPAGELKEIQVNGGMHPGNSGGPVVNSFGNVVGVAVSQIRGTTINFAVPAEKVRLIMDGRLAETAIGEAFLQEGQPLLPVRLTCLDPLNRVRTLRVDVWTGAAAEPRAGVSEPHPAAPGDGKRQTHKIAYRDGGGALDVPLPPLPAGKIYWLQPSILTDKGTQWEPAVPLAGPFYPLERKPARLVVSLTAQKERTVKLKSAQSLNLYKGKEKKTRAWTIEADVLEVLSPDPKGALLRTSFGPTVVSTDVDGKVTNDPEVSNALRQLPPAFLLDGSNQLQARRDRSLNPIMKPVLRQDLSETYAQFCKSMEAATMPMPNRMLEPTQTWQTQIPLIMSGGARAEIVDLALNCTYEGTRVRNERGEAVITMRGIVQGRGLNVNKIGGHVTGKVAFDLAGGFIAQAVFKISSDYDIQGIQVTDALDVHLDRAPGNPLKIAAPTDFKPGPDPNPGLVLEGKSILKLDGTLAATDPLYSDPNFQAKNARMKIHNVTLQAGKTYAIALNSTAFDSYLVLTSPQGQVVAEDDDGGGALNALIVHAPTQSGLYRITATAFDGRLGAYQLTVLELPAKK
jgi:S1-C subfamily serine protease